MPITSPDTYEDAWGIEDDVLEDPDACRLKVLRRDTAVRQRCLSSRQASVSQQYATGAFSLQAYCLGCLGQYIQELLEVGKEVLPVLPPDAKASLLAIARRQGLLDDAALAVLTDSSWTSLDLSDSSVTDCAVQRALSSIPQLLSLDLTGCTVSQQTIRMLGKWCPQLQVLRIGSKDVLKDHTWATSMKHIVPTVTQADSTYDSWELLASDEQASSSTAAQGATEQTTNMSCLYSRLDKLMYLIWPSIPIKTLELLTHKFPKVMVNPQSRSCPEQADPNIAVDEASMQSVAPFWEQEMLQDPPKAEYIMPVSERFRMAYVSRAERIAAKAERNYQQRRRRQLRNDTVLQALARFKFL